jgi:hypothetical protein
LPECIGLNHHLVKEITLRALKRADIETHTCRHDASEYHVSAALWASRAMDVEIDVVRQEIGFLHDAFPHREGGSATLSVTGRCLWRSAVMGTTLGLRAPRRCSILISLRSPKKLW